MKDNLSTIIAMIIFVVLMVIFPLYNYFERQDDMSYNLALKSTTSFVDSVISCGYINQEMYDSYVAKLGNTGIYYDIQLEVQKVIYTKDPYEVEKLNKLSLSTDEYNKRYIKIPYIEQYEADYNRDIFEEDTGEISSDVPSANEVDPSAKALKNGCYYLNEGDKIFVKIKNVSTTMAGAIFNIIVPTSSIERIKINYGGIVKTNAWKDTPQSQIEQGDIYVRIDIAETNFNTVSVGESITLDVTINNYDSSINNATYIKDTLLPNNLFLKNLDDNNVKISTTADNITVSGSNTWKVVFDIPDTQTIGQYEAVLSGGVIQGNIYKNSETKSKIIYIQE